MDTKAFVQDTVSRSLDKYLELHPDGGVPAGGTEGQTLVKTSDADGEVGWADVLTTDALDNRTLTPSGWGVAKVINDQVSGSSEYVDKSYDISDLGFTNADDYTVSAITTGGASGYGGSTKFYIKEGRKTATGFELRIDKAIGSTVKYQATIIGKGYGGTHFVDGTGLPVGGEDGQILTKIGNEDGVVDWHDDMGMYLSEFGRKYGVIPSQVPITRKSAKKSGGRFIIPIGGCITDYNSFIDGVLSNFDAYVTWKGSEYKVTSKSNNKMYFTNNYYWEVINLGSDWPLTSSKVSNGAMTQEDLSAVRFVAKGDNNFGLSNGTEPYDIRNLTGMVLDDLKVTENAVPTDWGIATKGLIQISNNGGEWGEATVDVSGFNFESADDYSASLLVAGGAGGYGGVNTYTKNKTTTGFVIHWARVSGGSATRVDYEYTIFAKGYGNVAMEGGTAMQHRVVGQEELIGDWTENGVTYDLYRKTIDCGALPDTTSKTVAHGIANKEKIISINGVAVGSSNNNNLTIPFAALENQYNIYVGVGPSNITLTTGTDRSSYNAHITIEFTRARA